MANSNRIRTYIILSVFVFSIFSLFIPLFGESAPPPQAPEKIIYDTLHGNIVPDPYRWLENGNDPEVQKWANAQDKYCRDLLNKYPKRKEIKKRLEQLLQIGAIWGPDVYKGRYFYFQRNADENHGVLYMKRGLEGKAEIVINPNKFSKDGTIALDWYYPSNDGKLIAFGKSSKGTERSTLFILDIDAKKLIADTIPFTGAADIAWLNDNSGFYYTRYPIPGTVAKEDEDYYRHIYFHKIGTDYKNDPKIFGEGLDKTEWTGIQISPDNKHLLISSSRGWSSSQLYLKSLAGDDTACVLLTSGVDAMFNAIMLNDRFYIQTNLWAPHYQVMIADYETPQIQHWGKIIPENETTIQNVRVVGKHIVVGCLYEASSRIQLYSFDGKSSGIVPMPSIGAVMGGVSGEWNGNEILFGYNSYFIPPTLYRFELSSNKLTEIDGIKTDIDLQQFEVERIWFTSKDGTKVSMFVTHKKGINLDGNNPTVVNGYGGFNSYEIPYFSRSEILWLERGGVTARVQLRGNGDYGEKWHQAGMLENKQNVFDDFIAACEYLISEKYTKPEKLVIEGGSNGGLLTGAVLVQRPDLMKAAISSRPLLDMLRYQKFLIGQLWVPEYGSADDPEQFKYLLAYSPYHNVKKGTAYPAVLFESADYDSRVDPNHARKMAAALQAATSSDNPILLRIERDTGHGQGAPMSKIIAETLDKWCFIFWQLGI